jgi:YVTN family beta-propeller protein
MSRSISTSLFGTILFALVLALALGGCSGGGGGPFVDGPDDPDGPSALTYAGFPATYARGVLAAPALPSVQGEVDAWTVEPALPQGLVLDAASGEIAGLPGDLTPAGTYRIEASGPYGSTSVEIVLEVVEPTTFAITGNVADDTLSVFVVNPQNGIHRPWSYTKTAPGESYPVHVVAHPAGSPIYVVNRDSDNLSTYDLDASNGRLIPRAPVAAAGRPTFLALHPDGRSAYAALSQTGYVQAYAVDPVDRSLSALGAPQFSGAGVERLSVRPDGRFLVAANSIGHSLRLFAIDQTDGSIESGAEVGSALAPRGMVWSSDSRWLFVADSAAGSISSYSSQPQSGALGLDSQVTVGGLPSGLAIDRFDRRLHVAVSGDNVLRTFAIDMEDGSLSQTGIPMLTGILPTGIALSATGQQLFVIDTASREVAVFAVDTATGQPTGKESARTREMPLGFALVASGKPAAPQPQFVYVTNRDSDSLSMFKSVNGEAQLAGIGPDVLTGNGPRGLASDPFARFVYAVTSESDELASYSIEPLGGELQEIDLPQPTGDTPHSVAVDLSARFAYVSNTGSSELSLFELSLHNGAPTPIGTLALGREPSGLVIEPTGRFLYTANKSLNGISILRIDPLTGALTAEVPELLTDAIPGSLTVHPTGRYLYATFGATGELRQYEIQSLDGSLSAIATVDSGVQPTAFTIDPRGRWGFATNFDALGTGDLSIFSLEQTDGVPELVGTHSAGLHPVDAAVGPSGRHLFVANQGSDDVQVFRIDADDGGLTLEETIAAGVSPERIVVTGTFGD